MKKEGEKDPETGWFYCFRCADNRERAIQADLQRDYDWYNSLDEERKAEVKSEYRLAGVYDFPP